MREPKQLNFILNEKGQYKATTPIGIFAIEREIFENLNPPETWYSIILYPYNLSPHHVGSSRDSKRAEERAQEYYNMAYKNAVTFVKEG